MAVFNLHGFLGTIKINAGTIILLIFILLNVIPIGINFKLISEKITLSLKFGSALLPVFPKKKAAGDAPEKKKKEKKKKTEEEKPEKAAKPKKAKKKKKGGLHFTFDELKAAVKSVFKGFGILLHGINIDKFMLHYTAAGSDPYKTAITYNYVNAIMSSLAPICAKRFRCKDADVWTDIDFTSPFIVPDIEFSVALRLWRLLAMILFILLALLWALVRHLFYMLYLLVFHKDEFDEIRSKKTIIDKLKEKKSAAEAKQETEENNTTDDILKGST